MWQLAGESAVVSLPEFEARVDVQEPWRGLLNPRWRGASLPAAFSPLQVEAREFLAPNRKPLEVYVRGRDLVATFAPSDLRNVQTQIYWRISPFASRSAVAIVELIVSAQTHLLDSRPILATTSVLPTSAVFYQNVHHPVWQELPSDGQSRWEFPASEPVQLFLFRPHGALFSYAEMVHVDDFSGASLEHRGSEILRLNHQLFPDRLEKGVIRRARICGAFLPREDDQAISVAIQQAFTAEPLPLTT